MGAGKLITVNQRYRLNSVDSAPVNSTLGQFTTSLLSAMTTERNANDEFFCSKF